MLIWGLQIGLYRYVQHDRDVEAGGYTWVSRPITGLNFNNLTSPLGAMVRVTIIDEAKELLELQASNTLMFTAASVWRITGDSQPYAATLQFSGAAERAVIGAELAITLDIGTAGMTSWQVPRYGPLCRYRSTSQCPYALTCAKSWAACTANAKQNIFGGYRWIPPIGFRLIWRETDGTVK